jgi:hypothetical protein
MYLDPGFGSMIIQVAIAALATGGVLIAMFWDRLRGLFGFKKKTDEGLLSEKEE